MQNFLLKKIHPRVRVLHPGKNLGPLGGQQYGRQRAKGKFLVNVDDDIIVPSMGWLGAMEKALLENPGLAFVSLPWVPASPRLNVGKIIEKSNYTLEIRDEAIFLMCAMMDRGIWIKHFSHLKNKSIYGDFEPVYYRALQKSGHKCGYLTTYFVRHLGRTKESDILYGAWKVLFGLYNSTELEFDKWLLSGQLTSEDIQRLKKFGYPQEQIEEIRSKFHRGSKYPQRQ